jgi:hypothetical protein
MALTRKSLKAMGLADEQVDSIVEMHTETVDGLKEKLKTAEEKATQLDGVQKELDALKAKGSDDYKARAEKAEKDLNDYKAEVAAKETKAAKEAAVRAYFEEKKITGGNLNIAMRGAKDEISGIELDAEGKIKDTAALDALVGGEFASLVVTTQTRGAQVETPPANNGGGKLTRADIYKKDDHGRYVMSTEDRQKALASNPDLMKG